jgi:two-component system cell cycle sensor histidine kinase/response regulator CckA
VKGGKKRPPEAESLRRQAEGRLHAGNRATAPTAATPGDAQRILHELQVHQVELELQNEELQRARVELEASLEKYFDLFDFAPVGYFTLDDRGAIVEANLAGAALLEVDRSRLIGRRLAEFVPDESRESLAGLLERLAADELRPRAEVALRQGPAGARLLLLEGAVSAALPGRESRYRVAATDISERVAAEREREHLRIRLEKAERMESVGRLAGGVAHDFNNMLGVILGFTEIASDRLDPEHPIHRDLDEIRTAAQRAAALTNKLLAFASRQPVQPRRLDLGESISNLLPLVRRLVGTAIDVDWSPASGLWPVRLDPGQFDQVLTDLTVNARDAIAGKGRLELRADNVTFERNRGAGGPVAGEYVRLTVTDSGAGMDAATLRHLFEPFFSKLPFGQGAGLGLATVYGVVRQNGGYVEVASEPERGTTFQLYWPRLLDDADPPVPKRGEAVADEAQKTVLLVDDEPALLRLVGTMVERLGHRTLAAGSPREALRLAARRSRRIDLLVTDVVMPEMNGRELADRLTALHPDLKLLFISGYSAEAIADHGILAEGVPFLRKPFTAEAFAAKVGAALRTTS